MSVLLTNPTHNAATCLYYQIQILCVFINGRVNKRCPWGLSFNFYTGFWTQQTAPERNLKVIPKYNNGAFKIIQFIVRQWLLSAVA